MQTKTLTERMREGEKIVVGMVHLLPLPATLREVGIDESKFDVMAARAGAGLQKAFVSMTAEDVKEIYKKSL